MLKVITPDQAVAEAERAFSGLRTEVETVPLERAAGRVLGEDVASGQFVPGFDRSTVDGYAVRARDTFGCGDSLPAVLALAGETAMGRGPSDPLAPDTCVKLPTGGALPRGADAVVMLEHCEDYRDGTVGVLRPAAPGENLICRGEDVRPGQVVLTAGTCLRPQDIGALAALGVTGVPVRRRPVAGILSTGDELVPPDRAPGPGCVRDVNGPMLRAAVEGWGCEAYCAGIVPDREELLEGAVRALAGRCDLVLLSGGSSVGERDAVCRVVEKLGEVLFHGIAMKPGKPTLLGRVGGRPVVGLPGHPAAACTAAHLLVRPLAAMLTGRRLQAVRRQAVLTEPVSANHGRAQYTPVRLELRDGVWLARPVHGKSGLISALAASDGYLCVPRDCEGFPGGSTVSVTLYSAD